MAEIDTMMNSFLYSTSYSMGAGDMTFQEFSQREGLKTGGLSVGSHLCQYHSDIMSYEQVSQSLNPSKQVQNRKICFDIA